MQTCIIYIFVWSFNECSMQIQCNFNKVSMILQWNCNTFCNLIEISLKLQHKCNYHVWLKCKGNGIRIWLSISLLSLSERHTYLSNTYILLFHSLSITFHNCTFVAVSMKFEWNYKKCNFISISLLFPLNCNQPAKHMYFFI